MHSFSANSLQSRRGGVVRNGFTILELLLVMVIAGIVAGIAIPAIDTTAMDVNTAARQVAMTLLKAQRLAVLRQHAVVVAFDTAGRRLRLHEDRNNDGVVGANELLDFVELEGASVFGRGPAPALPFGGAAVNLMKTQDGMPAITFHRSGSAGENGGLYITSRRAAAGGIFAKDARAFEINRATGRVSMLQYSDSWRSTF